MRYLLLITAIILASLKPAIMQRSLRVKGSDTCLPVIQMISEKFMNLNPDASVTVTGGGSGVGITSLMNGTTDITMSSRRMKMDEKLNTQLADKPFKEIVFALDALSVIVNPVNNVDQLTREQLEGIFTGKIKNWKELGGDDLSIIVYSRESSSGTVEFFKEKVLDNKNFALSALNLPASGAVVQSISQTKGAIGFVGLAYVENSVKPLKISFDGGLSYIAATNENALNESYPVTRPLYLYYPLNMEKMVKPFVDFILSAEGQKIVNNEGYIPVIK